jgi:hypothetical protein
LKLVLPDGQVKKRGSPSHLSVSSFN